MLWVIREIFMGIHIFLAIVWVGGILFIGWGVFPAVRIIHVSEQRRFLLALMNRTHWLFTLAGIGVIATGILLGTVFGPIQDWNFLWNTRYGKVWLTALILALFTLSWGIFIGYKQTMRMLSNDTLWQQAEVGSFHLLNQAMVKTAILESVEIIGFLAILICMILIR